MGEILVGATRGVPQQDGQNCVFAFRRRDCKKIFTKADTGSNKHGVMGVIGVEQS